MAEKGSAFDEAIAYHRSKLALPSKSWTDIWGREHGRAFIVAGAASDDLVTGFHEAISQAMAQGKTLTDFRQDFDRLVRDHGWSYNGSRGWRSAVIYNTNLSQAYSAGRWEQGKQLPDAVGRYRHNPSPNERAEHRAKNGITLPLSHSFWTTWWPINAWGCHCQVDILSGRAAQAAGWVVSDDPPLDQMVQRTINTAHGPKTVTIPKGIDPGFDYNPGEAAFGHQLNQDVMDEWRAKKRDAWEVTNKGDWNSHDRPDMIPVDAAQARIGRPAQDRDDLAVIVEQVIGGKEKVFTLPDGSRILVDAKALADHIDLARAPFVPFLPELLADPFEIWLAFERHKGTGRVELRKRLVKVIDTKKGALTLSAQVHKGRLEAWTFVPSDRPKQLARSRVGKMTWGRADMGPSPNPADGAPDDGQQGRPQPSSS